MQPKKGGRSMSDVIITGLGIGKEFGACDVDNMNYRVLLQNPHVLLWADLICIIFCIGV